MTPGWGRKRCIRRRRPCSPPICMPMPRPCLDSLQIPLLQPCAFHRTPRTGFFPRCVQPFCGIKHRTCRCARKNYCTAETCTNSTSCMQSQNFFSPNSFQGDKDEYNTCNGTWRQQKCHGSNNVEDYEIVEPTCNEALCEEMETCGAGAISNDEELIRPFTYTPSVINQRSLSSTPPIVPSREEPFNNNSARKTTHINVSLTGEGMTPKCNNYDAVNKESNVNRCIQVNMQNETIFGKRRDAESSVAPEVCCSGNDVPMSLTLSRSSQCELRNFDNMSVPVPNIHSSFDHALEKYDTNVQSHSQPSKATESYLNTHVSNVEDNGRYFRDNAISFSDENNNNPNKSVLKPCCKHGFDLSASASTYQKQLTDSENDEFGDVYQRIRKLPQQNAKLYSELFGNRAKRNNMNDTPMQSAPQRSPGINKDSLRIRDNSEHILAKENVLFNVIPPNAKTTQGNASTCNELSKTSLLGNNSTNEKRLFNEGKNQFMSSVPNDCRISGTTQGYLNYSESTSQKSPQFMTSSAPISQIRSFNKRPLTNNSSQVRFHDNNHINNATFCSPIENQNHKYSSLSRSSKLRINDHSSKNMKNKIQPTNSVFFDHNGVICEDCKHGCCTHDEPNIACVCPNENEYLTETKCKQKNIRKLTTHDLKNIKCKKKPACIIEDGTTSCASMTCVVNQHLGCSCRYPPAFRQFSCTGNISGVCNCNDKE